MTFPNMPQGFAATASDPSTGSGQATVALAWTANPAGDAVIEYRVYRTPTARFAPMPVAAISGTSYTDGSAELLPNTRWYYFVVAVNASGTSPASATANVMIPLPLALPSAPSGLAATANSDDTVSLSWNANPAGQIVTGYDVYREATGTTSATLVATVSGTSYTDTGSALAPGSGWTYYLKAVNATGASPASATASVTIPQSQSGGTLIASFEVNNYGSSSVTNPQITFAQPFAPGDVPSGNHIQLRKSDGVTVVPAQQDQEATWLQDGSWKTVAISSISPDTFAAGETISYQLWAVPGSPNRTPAVSLAQFTAATDIRLAFENAVIDGVSIGDFNPGDVWEVSVNDIVANGAAWPWTAAPITVTNVARDGNGNIVLSGTPAVQVGQYVADSLGQVSAGYVVLSVSPNYPSAGETTITVGPPGGAAWLNGFTSATWTFTTGPTRGWEVLRQGPLCTEWRLWGVLRCTTSGGATPVGAVHPWIRGVLYVRVWTPGGSFNAATSPIEIGGYWAQSNIFGANPEAAPAGVTWTQISGANYQLVEYYRAPATETNLDVAIGTGSGNVNGGIGDAIVGPAGTPPSLDGSVRNYTNVSAASLQLPPLSINGADRVIVVSLLSNTKAPTSITSSLGLVYQQRGQTVVNASGIDVYCTSYWANASAVSSGSETITANFANGNATYIMATAFALSGAANPASPFDAVSPVTTTGPGDLTISTSNQSTFIFGAYRFTSTANPTAGGATFPPETKYVFQAQLVNGNTVLMQWGGANDGNPNFSQSNRTISGIPASAVNTSNGQITVTQSQLNSMLGAASPYNAPLSELGCGGVPVVLSTTGTLPGGLVAASGGTTVSNPYWCANYNAGINGSLTSGPVLMMAGTKWGSTDSPGGLGNPNTRYDGSPNGAYSSFTAAPAGTLTITPLAESFPNHAVPAYDWDGRRVWMVNGTSVGVAKPTILVAHDFVYLTNKSRCVPPYLPPSNVNAQSTITMDSSNSPPAPVNYSQGSQYFCVALNQVGDNYGDDRIGWLNFHQAMELYRPFDYNLHTLNLGVALSWMHNRYWTLDESHANLPVVNLTQYPNFGAPLGPNVQFGGAGFFLNVSGTWIDQWDYMSANYDRYSHAINGAHMPSPNILPYLRTGDFIHYEAMMMLAACRWYGSPYSTCTAGVPGGTNAAGQALGVVTTYKTWSHIDANFGDDSLAMRGMGWMMRHVGTAVHFMPDNLGDGATPRPEKQYIRDQFHDTVRILDAKTEPAQTGYNTFPAGLQNLGIVMCELQFPRQVGLVVNFSSFAHDYGFIGWAMEAWRGEYPELLDLVGNYWGRFAVGRYDENGTGPAGPGCMFFTNVYNDYALSDLSGNWLTTFDECLANQAYGWYLPNLGIASYTAGSNKLTFDYLPASLNYFNFFISIWNFPNDLPAYCCTDQNGWNGNGYVNTFTFNSIVSGQTEVAANATVTRQALTTTATGADGAYNTYTLTVASVGSGANAVQVGYGVVDTSRGAIQLATGYSYPTFVTAINGNTLTLSKPIGFDANALGQGQLGVQAGDTIIIGPVIFANELPFPWPGISTFLKLDGTNGTPDLHDYMNFNAGQPTYTQGQSYTGAGAICAALGDCVYRATGNPNLAHAAAVYAEFRRRMYFTPTIQYRSGSSPLSFNNAPVWAIGTIGSTS
jgi:fibronectin type 3 domain-containing protein